MKSSQATSVAVLLATHNGARYTWPQLRSLRDNVTDFTLHWLDDHSSDKTRAAVRSCTSDCGIDLHEWPQPDHLGVPRSYFRLLELVEADIYLFCDQDDIWQPGKLDATVDNLLPRIASPALCFTDYLTFEDGRPGIFTDPRSVADKRELSKSIHESVIYAFLPGGPSAQTQGFTRPLRDVFLRHKEIATTTAAMHDWWMYDIATACCAITWLEDAPKVLYRRHPNSFCASLFQTSKSRPMMSWHRNQLLRQLVARHARGLLLASATLPSGDKLSGMLRYARLAASMDSRQSLSSALRLLRSGVKCMASPLSMLLACLLTSADGGVLEADAAATGLLPGDSHDVTGPA